MCSDLTTELRFSRALLKPAEVARYEEFDRRHGACYLAPGGEAAAMDEVGLVTALLGMGRVLQGFIALRAWLSHCLALGGDVTDADC